MLKKSSLLFSMSLLSASIFSAHAATVNENHAVIAPHCLVKNVNAPYQTLSSNQFLSFIRTNQTGIDQLIALKTKQKQLCGGFMDVTAAWREFNSKHSESNAAQAFLNEYNMQAQAAKSTTNYEIRYEKEVNQVIKPLNPQDFWNDLTTLTQFTDRYAKGDNGVKAAAWIKTQIETLAQQNNHQDVTVYYVQTGNYLQPSVVAKVGTSNEPGIVVGGHMDTLSSMFSPKPGADDDGSGTVTILETARLILSSGMHFKKPIYFIWYAAEEEGLIGSQYVVADFKKNNIPVDAVMQLDMTGYAYQNDPTIYLVNDYVNADLTNYLQTLIGTYVKQPVQLTKCGYACSDHATWTKNNYPASIPFEASFNHDNPDIHSSNDTMDKLSREHITDFVKLATAFAVELAEPV